MNDLADVCIVGFGVAGAILAKQLGTAGLQVVVLERGPWLTFNDYAHKDSIRAGPRRGLEPTVRSDPVYFRPRPGGPVSRLLTSNPTNAVGGAMTFWTGLATRFTPGDFRVHSEDVADGAAQRAGADLTGYEIGDWPISYDELDPWYEVFEWEFGVSGDDTGNPFRAPRRRGYPLPPLHEGLSADLFAATCRQLGYHPYPNPNGIASQPYRPPPPFDHRIAERRACTYCAHCHDYGCHVQAKAAPLYTVAPVALATGNVELRTGARAARIDLEGDRHARSVSYFDASGQLHKQHARVIVIAGYVFENSRLLLLSASDSGPHRNGIGNRGGQVGRGIMAHQDLIVAGIFENRTINGFVGPLTAGQRIDDFYGNHFDHTGLGFIRGGGISAAGGGTPLERYFLVPPGVPRWGKAYKDYLARYYRRQFALSIQPETLPHRENRITLDGRRRDRNGMAAPVVTFQLHQNEQRLRRFLFDVGESIMRATGASKVWSVPVPMPYRWAGGTAMGLDPTDSVVDAHLRVHGIDNLYVTGASVFRTLTSFPATATVSALAYRAADRIIADLR